MALKKQLVKIFIMKSCQHMHALTVLFIPLAAFEHASQSFQLAWLQVICSYNAINLIKMSCLSICLRFEVPGIIVPIHLFFWSSFAWAAFQYALTTLMWCMKGLKLCRAMNGNKLHACPEKCCRLPHTQPCKRYRRRIREGGVPNGAHASAKPFLGCSHACK